MPAIMEHKVPEAISVALIKLRAADAGMQAALAQMHRTLDALAENTRKLAALHREAKGT